jgi:hypothetical protein
MLIVAAPATAQESPGSSSSGFRLFGSVATYFEQNEPEAGEPGDHDYTKLQQLYSLNLAWAAFSAGIQAEYLHYSDRAHVDPLDLDRLRDSWELRKYYLEYYKSRFSARLGTFYSSFGHGLTLYVQKNDALGLDEPVHGATATLSLGRLDFTAFGGEVTEPQLELRYNRRFKDELKGGRIVARLPYDLHLGGSYVDAKLDRFYPEGVDDLEVWSIEAGGVGVANLIDIEGEWAEIERTEGARVKEGYGRYLSLSSTFGPITILGEFKDYWSFDYRYNNPPTAGRTIDSYDHSDVKGARLKVDGDVAAIGALLYASYAEFDSHKRQTSPGGFNGDRQVEWYAGIEELAGPVYFEGSWFSRSFTDRGIDERHLIADLHIGVAARGEINMGYDARLEKSSYFRTEIHRSHIAYSIAPWGTLSIRYAWDEQSQFDTEEFWAGEIEVNPMSQITVSLFAGSDPGGLVCSGGQCREEPRFKGLKTRFTLRF